MTSPVSYPLLVYSCSGCSSAAQMANWIAVQLDRNGIAEMSCIAGIGGDVPALVRVARSGRPIIALDGCPLHCTLYCLRRHGVTPDLLYTLSDYGVQKKSHRDFDPDEAKQLYHTITEEIRRRGMLADAFTTIFRDEHRKVRDTLLDLIVAFQERNRGAIQSLLIQTAALTGPHFRYEEEAVYPALVDIFGAEYIEQLLNAHDQAIGIAQKLVRLAGHDPLTDEDVSEAVRLVRKVLPHVSDCDGLSIMVERLPEKKVRSILKTREAARQANLNLLQWTEQVRPRPPAMVA